MHSQQVVQSHVCLILGITYTVFHIDKVHVTALKSYVSASVEFCKGHWRATNAADIWCFPENKVSFDSQIPQGHFQGLFCPPPGMSCDHHEVVFPVKSLEGEMKNFNPRWKDKHALKLNFPPCIRIYSQFF